MREGLFVSDDVRDLRRILTGVVDEPGFHELPIGRQVSAMAERLAARHAAGDARGTPVLSCWHPDLVGSSAALLAGRTIDAEAFALAVAREHGFRDAAEADAAGSHDPRFEEAVDATVQGDADVLRRLLAERPELARARSSHGHRATLLHYLGANGVETWRQVVPANAPELAALLIDHGAEPDAIADIYGGSTTLALASTSAHVREAGVLGRLQRVLVEAGARGEAPPTTT